MTHHILMICRAMYTERLTGEGLFHGVKGFPMYLASVLGFIFDNSLTKLSTMT